MKALRISTALLISLSIAIIRPSAILAAEGDGKAQQIVVPIEKGDTAPFPGLLFPESKAAKYADDLLKLDQIEFENKKLKQQLEVTEEVYKNALKNSGQKWYQAPELQRWTGFLLGFGLATVAMYGAKQLK